MPPEAEQAGMTRRPTESERRRMYRDLALSLRCGLRDAAAGFSFLRLRGLRALLRALRSDDADLGLFRDSQAIRDLQGLHDHITSRTPSFVTGSLPLLSLRLDSLAFSFLTKSVMPATAMCSGPGAVRAQPAQADRRRGGDGGAGAGHGARRRQDQEPRHGLGGRARAQGAPGLLPPLPGLRRRGAPLQCRQGTASPRSAQLSVSISLSVRAFLLGDFASSSLFRHCIVQSTSGSLLLVGTFLSHVCHRNVLST